MKIEKLKIDHKKLDLNLKFYFLLKYILKAGLTQAQSSDLLEKISLGLSFDEMQKCTEGISKSFKKQEALELLFEQIENEEDLEMFVFSLKLYTIKDALLAESKMGALINSEKLKDLDPLSINYDKISVQRPYYTRLNGSLISLLFFTKKRIIPRVISLQSK